MPRGRGPGQRVGRGSGFHPCTASSDAKEMPILLKPMAGTGVQDPGRENVPLLLKVVDVLDHDALTVTAEMEVLDRNTLMATRVHRLFSVQLFTQIYHSEGGIPCSAEKTPSPRR